MAPVTEEMSKVLPAKEKHNFLNKESKRLKTFTNWPVPFLKAADLAKDGFFYTNVNDVVKCAFCKIQIGYWEEGDNPHIDHIRLSPNCPLLKNEMCGNVPLRDGQENEEGNEFPISQDVCGIYPLHLRPFSGPERPSKEAFSIDSSNLWRDFEALGVSKISEPVAPNFATMESRLETFKKWKAHDIQSPEKLAEAGFYYVGPEDNVLCFHCGGGLKNWEKDEDPWVEHARWFHKCHFVILQKGREFIHEALSKKKVVLTAETLREIINSRKNSIGDTNKSNSVKSVVQNELNMKPLNTDRNTEHRKNFSVQPSNIVKTSMEKNQCSEFKDIQLCTVCREQEREIVFLPCGHFACCFKCASSMKNCSMCNDLFQATVRAYLS